MNLKLATVAILATLACSAANAADANGVSLKITGVAVADDTKDGRCGDAFEFLPSETRVVVPSDKQLALFRVEYDAPTNIATTTTIVLEPSCDMADMRRCRFRTMPTGPRRGSGVETMAFGLRGDMYDKGLLVKSVRLSYVKTDDDGVNSLYFCDVPVNILFAKDGEKKTDGFEVLEPLPPPPAKTLSLLPGWTEDFKAAMAQAKKERKLVLAYFLNSRPGNDGKAPAVLDHKVLGSEEFLKRAGESYVCFMAELNWASMSWSALREQNNAGLAFKYAARNKNVRLPAVAIIRPDGSRVALLDGEGWEGGVDGYLAKIREKEIKTYQKFETEKKARPEEEKVPPKTDAGGADLDAKSAEVCRRMKAIVLPGMVCRPPVTLADAIEYFRSASIDYDSPEIPKEERGFDFILEMGDDGAPVLPEIKLQSIPLYDVLKIVCEAVRYQFVVENGIVIVKPCDEAKE